jgi:hypothetical protein
MRYVGMPQKIGASPENTPPSLPAPQPTPALPPAQNNSSHPELHDDIDITRNVAAWIDEEYKKIRLEELERV